MPTTPTTDPMAPVELAPSVTSPVVPGLEEIESWKPGERRVFRGVDWAFYERLHEIVGERPGLRIAFDGRDLEIMPISQLHEEDAWFGAAFVETIASELVIPRRSLGSSTWKRGALMRGIEADASFYLTTEKVASAASARSRRSSNPDDYPNPDLAIEVDISEPRVDRPGIHAALQVPEIWRFRGQAVIIERLDEQGNYIATDASGFLPVRAVEVARWVFQEDSSDPSAWEQRLRAWIRAELAGRRASP